METEAQLNVKPFVKWVGGKTQLLAKIKELMPPSYGDYYEPFAGGGALFFNLKPRVAYINDINPDLIAAYKCFKNEQCYLDMVNMLRIHEENNSEEYFMRVRSMDRIEGFHTLPKYLIAARMIYLNKACFNGLFRVNSKGYFNTSWGKKDVVKAYDPENFERIKNYFAESDITITSEDYFVALTNVKRDDFVYIDSPYDLFDRQSNFTSYTKESFGVPEQTRLARIARLLTNTGVKVMLSNHNTPLINQLYQGFNITVVPARRMINSDAAGRGNVEEVIITNYSTEGELITW